MSQSKSSPTNTTANTSTVSTTNNNVSGNSGVTLANNGTGNSSTLNLSTVNNTLDPAVVTAALSSNATAFGTSAQLAQSAISSNQSVDQATIDATTGLSKQALAIASGALASANEQNVNSLDTLNTLASGFATQLDGVVTSEQAALLQDQAASQTQLANVTNALTTSFVQGTTSANQSVINAVSAAGAQETDIIKYLAIAAGLIGAVYFYRKAA
jgi:hypothetical protein